MELNVHGARIHVRLPGSCLVCGQGTDTGLAARGSRIWQAAVLAFVGVEERTALAIVKHHGEDSIGFRVCTACVPDPDIKPALVIDGGDIPVFEEPVEAEEAWV